MTLTFKIIFGCFIMAFICVIIFARLDKNQNKQSHDTTDIDSIIGSTIKTTLKNNDHDFDTIQKYDTSTLIGELKYHYIGKPEYYLIEHRGVPRFSDDFKGIEILSYPFSDSKNIKQKPHLFDFSIRNDTIKFIRDVGLNSDYHDSIVDEEN